ncbi:hypothetical protein F5879DRAFT_1057485 [Lentinula edodes]|nr:hypothetical protein F5879DRAFT_1057485 [Lentinula edodes]
MSNHPHTDTDNAHHGGHSTGHRYTDARDAPCEGEKENCPIQLQQLEAEVNQLRARNAELEHVAQMKNSSESRENVPERSIPRPSNLKNTSIAEIRQHMGLEGKDSDSKKNWLNHRKTVRDALTGAQLDYNLDLRSQDTMKIAKCIQVIDDCHPLFKRFKGSWASHFVLRQCWSNRVEWLDNRGARLDGEDTAGASIGQTSSSNDSSTPLPSNEQRESSLTPPPTPSHSQDSPPPRSSIHNAISPHSPRGSKHCHMLSATPSDEEDIDSSSKADTQAMTSQSVPKKKKKITSQSRSAAARKGAQTRAARKAAQQQGKPTVST